MASISYEDIYSDFLGRVTDYSLISAVPVNSYELLDEWARKAIKPAYVRRLFSSISFDDDTETITFVMSNPKNDSEDIDFVTDVITGQMIVAWLEPQVRKTSLTSQMFSGKESKFYSQASHLAELRGLLDDARQGVRKAIRDRGYVNNSYLEES